MQESDERLMNLFWGFSFMRNINIKEDDPLDKLLVRHDASRGIITDERGIWLYLPSPPMTTSGQSSDANCHWYALENGDVLTEPPPKYTRARTEHGPEIMCGNKRCFQKAVRYGWRGPIVDRELPECGESTSVQSTVGG